MDYGENQPTMDYGECLPAIKDHSKDLDNNGEITTKLISTIATHDPVTNSMIDHVCLITDPLNTRDNDATLLPTFKHGDSFED